MVETGAMKHPENPNIPASNVGHKWEVHIREFWYEHLKEPKEAAKRAEKQSK